MIRIAAPEDRLLVESLVENLIEDSKYKGFFEGFRDLVPVYLDRANKNNICVVVLDGEEAVGLGGFDFFEHPFYIARIAAIYVKKEFRNKGFASEILDTFEIWGKIVGAKMYNLGISTGADLTKRGYKEYEVLYMKEVK